MIKKLTGFGIILIAAACLLLGKCSRSRDVEFTTSAAASSETVREDADHEKTPDSSAEAMGTGTEGAESPDASRQETGQEQVQTTRLCVYVCGQVRCPGVYELEEGKRICDAISAAGGMTGEAAADYWNLAELLTDGQMIYVPDEKEARERAEGMPGTKADSEAAGDGKVNINTADKAELMTISGIGEGRAGAIISYREKNGAFGCIEDLTRVSGIGDALLESIKDMIKVY